MKITSKRRLAFFANRLGTAAGDSRKRDGKIYPPVEKLRAHGNILTEANRHRPCDAPQQDRRDTAFVEQQMRICYSNFRTGQLHDWRAPVVEEYKL